VPGLGYSRNEFLIMLIVGVVFFGIFTLVAGPLAERLGRRRMLIWTTVGIIVFGLLFVPLFTAGFVGVNGLLILGFILMGLTYGPMGAELPELFATNVRYTGSGVSYNVAGILGASAAPAIALALWTAAHGSTLLVGIYLSVAGVITLVALFFSKETRDSDFTTIVE
jgi:MFS family permease